MKVKEFIELYDINPTAKNLKVIDDLKKESKLTLKKYVNGVISLRQIAAICSTTAKTLAELRKSTKEHSQLKYMLLRKHSVKLVAKAMKEQSKQHSR